MTILALIVSAILGATPLSAAQVGQLAALEPVDSLDTVYTETDSWWQNGSGERLDFTWDTYISIWVQAETSNVRRYGAIFIAWEDDLAYLVVAFPDRDWHGEYAAVYDAAALRDIIYVH